MKNSLITLFLLIITAPLHTMERKQDNDSQFHAIMLGLKEGSPYGRGCESFEKNSIINCQNEQYKTLANWKFDVYQGNCIQDFDTKFKNNPNIQNKQLILAGVAGGAGTEINWLAQQSPEIKANIKALITEAVVIDNEFTIHDAESICKPATYLPFAQFWIPVLAKYYYPTYNPWSKKPIDELHKLPKELPVIIMHAKGDPICPINSSRKLYCELTKGGNPNAYLFEVDSNVHLNVFESDPEKDKKIKALQEIYEKHHLPAKTITGKGETNNFNFSEFQPSIEEVEKKIFESSFYPRMTRNVIDITTTLFAGYLIYTHWLLSDL